MTWMDYTDIKCIQACETVNSRGIPLLEIEVRLEGDAIGHATLPCEMAFDMREAPLPPDGIHVGKITPKPAWKINQYIAPFLKGMNALNQRAVDRALMEAERLQPQEGLGTNILLGISVAVANAAANSCNLPLFQYLGGAFARRMPVPMLTVLNGGIHAGWQGVDLQEFMIAPAGAENYSEALRWNHDVYQKLQTILKKNGFSTVNGFAPPLKHNADAFELIITAIEKAGYRPGEDIVLAIDAAASQFYEDGMYYLRTENRRVTAVEMIDMYADWVKRYPIALLEDGLAKDDWEGWKRLNSTLGCEIELIGDALFDTDVKRISRGIEENVANAILIKPQQIGSITETINALQLAYDADWAAMISHQCSEFADCFVADFTVAFGTGHIKIRPPQHPEHDKAYNPLLGIDEYFGHETIYAGHKAFARNKYGSTVTQQP